MPQHDDFSAEPPMPWMTNAGCLDSDPEIWFPNVGNGGVPSEPAREICTTCRVKPDCLEYALKDPRLEGIWAGTNREERKAIRKQRREAGK